MAYQITLVYDERMKPAYHAVLDYRGFAIFKGTKAECQEHVQKLSR